MPAKRKPKASKRQPEVWVAPDLMQKMKGAEGNRGIHVPQSPYLVLADRFLGIENTDHEDLGSRNGHRTAHPVHRLKETANQADEAPRAMAAAAGALGGGGVSSPGFSSLPPRPEYPKPPARPTTPHPPKLAASGLPGRPNLPKLQPPKPPKLTFGYRRKVDRAK